jgi:ABC-2 type transport system permease protein
MGDETMLEIARYRGRHRIKGSVVMAVGFSLFAGLVIWIYPSMASSVNLNELPCRPTRNRC